MQYRKFGNTGIEISTLGYGCMRLPENAKEGYTVDDSLAIPMLQRAYELGVNYFDSAYYYLKGNSEKVLGKAVKGFRDKVYLSTKVPVGEIKEKSDYRRFLESSLEKMDTDYIDFYHFWSLNRESYDDKVKKMGLLEEALKAKEEGLIRHISFSFHGNPDDVKYIIDDAGIMESVLLQYNLLDQSYADAFAYAASKGLGTVAMGPVGGGRLAAPAELYKKVMGKDSTATYEMALRFVLGNSNICCALSGMKSIEEVESNVAVMSSSEPFSAEENKKMGQAMEDLKKFSDLYCTGCKYCMPCPKEIEIAWSFYLYTLYNVYGLKEHAVEKYASYKEKHAEKGLLTSCIGCGACEKKCPQKLPIIEKLKLVDKTLSR